MKTLRQFDLCTVRRGTRLGVAVISVREQAARLDYRQGRRDERERCRVVPAPDALQDEVQ